MLIKNLNTRIDSLDIIRGIALFGILLVNMPLFQTPKLIADLNFVTFPLSTTDQWLRILLDVFIETKFFSIFSILFGLGFYIFMKNGEEKGKPYVRMYVRRLLFLAIIGFIHIILLWYGDILLTYALAGFLLIIFYKQSSKALLITWWVLTVVLISLLSLNFFASPVEVEKELLVLQAEGTEKVERAIDYYQDSNYMEWIKYRFHHEFIPILENLPFSILSAFYMFLVGLYIGKRNLISNFQTNKRFLKYVWWITLIISLPISIFIVLLHLDLFNLGVLTHIYLQTMITISGLSVSLFYLTSLLFLLQHRFWAKSLSPFKYVGRMALTNYLIQSIIGISIFVGAGLFGEINLRIGIGLSVMIFSLQLINSYVWLKYFQYGPLEWLWRSFTYGKLQRLK
ncbi:DUF418 domain-containing protein [Alkalihalobacillus sp. 1P02AB]|uniref:DUF418 domain-containing protein n=1 Tax=Alkalihalobacillus sp. 1P02AB TaxID=3132260 RepID=UPI0039A620E4